VDICRLVVSLVLLYVILFQEGNHGFVAGVLAWLIFVLLLTGGCLLPQGIDS